MLAGQGGQRRGRRGRERSFFQYSFHVYLAVDVVFFQYFFHVYFAVNIVFFNTLSTFFFLMPKSPYNNNISFHWLYFLNMWFCCKLNTWPSIFSGEWSRQLPKCDSYLWTELLYTQMRFIRIVRAAYHYFKYLVADATLFFIFWFHTLHCTKNWIYVRIPKTELINLRPYSYIHVSVGDLYIPRIGPHIWLQQNTVDRPNLEIYFSHMRMSVGIRRQNLIILFLEITRLHSFISGNT